MSSNKQKCEQFKRKFPYFLKKDTSIIEATLQLKWEKKRFKAKLNPSPDIPVLVTNWKNAPRFYIMKDNKPWQQPIELGTLSFVSETKS